MAISKLEVPGLGVPTVGGRSPRPSHLPASVATFRRPDDAQPDLIALGDDFQELALQFEADQRTLWCTFQHVEHPCFTPRLLTEIERLQIRLQQRFGHRIRWSGAPLQAIIWESAMPGVWNLGGDLGLFIRLIRAGAEPELRHYAYRCVDTVYRNLTKFGLPVLTIALVQGDALGGGFEAVLTNDLIIAEQGSKFGLPEVLFNLFPGMGAYSLLCRRLDGCRARDMILSGRIYDAEELAAIGLIDQVVAPGDGRAAVRAYLDRHARRLPVLNALSAVRRRCQPVDRDELIDVADVWVDVALTLTEPDLRRMARLGGAQRRRHRSGVPPATADASLYPVRAAIG